MILGLVVVTPVLMPWIAGTRRRYVALAGGVAMSMPILTMATYRVRGAPTVWIETPWTWWIFYVGLYLMGWALRNVIVTKSLLLLLGLAVLTLSVLGAWAWNNPHLPAEIVYISPTSYYSLGCVLLAVLVFVGFHSLLAAVAPFTRLVEGKAARWGRTLGDATLGVYALHPAAIVAIITWGWPSDKGPVDHAWQLVVRYLVVFCGVYVIVLLGRRVPFLRRVL